MPTSTLPAGLITGTWAIDAAHSHIEFTARHLMVSKVRGRFGSFEGNIVVADEPTASSVAVTIDPASVDTSEPKRDEHLRTNDFFAIADHPQWSFTSTAIRADGDDWVVTGDLTMRGVTRSVDLEVEFNGVAKDPWGGTRSGFSAQVEVSRKDWGIDFNAPLETGGVVVGDKIKINLEIEAVLQTPAA